MPYQEHQAFNPPENRDQKIWRYMAFSKFVSNLDKKALFFSRVDLLGDPYEGSVSKPTVEAREAAYRQLQKEQDLPDQVVEHLLKSSPELTQNARAFIFVNCWNMSDYESPALWAIYGKRKESIALQSTFSRLVESLASAEQSVQIGTVSYLDYEEEYMPAANLFHPSLHKRRGFDHEKELRAAIMQVPIKKNSGIDVDLLKSTRGHHILVDFDALIERLYVHPTVPNWFLELVESIMRKYDLGDKEIVRSTLALQPAF